MGKDPAFLFYSADAAQDVSHMNRLERGCYFDIIQSQKKFGRLSEDLIKKILGHDFEMCWSAVQICLSYDDHMYFIDWLENSIKKRIAYSESRRTNKISKKSDHMLNISSSYDEHMENEIENRNINENATKNEDRTISLFKKAKESFLLEVKNHSGYPEEMKIEFIEYWTETNKTGKKMRFQIEKTWDTSKRLARWSNNNKTFTVKKNQYNSTQSKPDQFKQENNDIPMFKF